jgi:hypothetical protein
MAYFFGAKSPIFAIVAIAICQGSILDFCMSAKLETVDSNHIRAQPVLKILLSLTTCQRGHGQDACDVVLTSHLVRLLLTKLLLPSKALVSGTVLLIVTSSQTC